MPQPADLLITNARVFTADPDHPSAEAVSVTGRHISFVGSNADAEAWRGPATRVIDGQGGTLLPGFIDSHYHLLLGSVELGAIQLGDVAGLADLKRAVRDFSAANADLPLLQGYGLLYAALPDQTVTRQQLDAIEVDRPLLLYSYDGHTAWANTRALEWGGILHGGEAGPNAEIVMGADGMAAGELREPGAYGPIRDRIPEPDDTRKRALLHQGLRQAASLGITSIHNMDGDPEQIALYAALEDLGELTLRVYCPITIRPTTPPESLADYVPLRETYHGGLVRAGSLKFFMDGVIESYTALLLDDYADRPGCTGDAHYSADLFATFATEGDRLGFQILVHAIGDGAVRRTLDGFEAARRANSPRDSRHRIEHIEVVHPDDLPRFAELGVIASMQPLHCPPDAGDSDVWPSRVGPHRWGRSFAWQALREAGATLVFGSDWPVVSQSPLRGLAAAVNRRPWQEGDPAHYQTLEAALVAYTRAAAYAEFQEHYKGQVKPGYLADLVLLSADLFAIPPDELETVSPIMTLCDGRVVYEA